MKLEFSEEDLQLFARAIALEVAKELKPALNKLQGQDCDVIFDVPGLAKYLKLQQSWIYAHIGEIPHSKLHRFPRFKKREIDRWLERHKAPNMKYL